MAYEVAIRITSEADLKALGLSEEATKRVTAEMQKANQVMGQETQRAAEQGAAAHGKVDAAAAKAVITHRNLGSAIGIAAVQFGGLGSVANIASNAIIAMTTSAGPAGIALGALAVTVGFLAYRLEQARDRMREIAEFGLARLSQETKNLDLENTVKRQIAVLQSAVPEIEAVRQKYDELRLAAEKSGARPQAIAAIDQARELEIGNLLKKQAEERAKALETERKALEAKAAAEAAAIESSRAGLVGQIEAVRQQAVALGEGESAAIDYGIAILSGSEAVKKLGAEGEFLLRVLRQERQALLASNQALEDRAALMKVAADTAAAVDKDLEEENRIRREQLALQQQSNEFELQRLRIAGAPEATVIEKQIELLREQRRALEDSGLGDIGEIERLTQAQQIAELQLLKLKTTSIDVAGEVSRVVTDITSAVINGTLKWADIGRSVLASFVRLALEEFTGFLRQMQAAAQSSSLLALLLGGGGGGGGSPWSNILASSAGGIAQLGANTTFSVAGGGGGGGGGFGGGGGIIGSTISTGASLLQNTELGAQVTAFLAELSVTISETVSTVLTSVTKTLSYLGPYGWIAAAIIAAISIIYRIVANQQERPNAKLSGDFTGVAFDESSQQFVPGDINVAIGRKVGIKNSQASQIATNLQQRLIVLSDQWTAILNVFPDMLANDIIPALDETNQRLNYNFANLKFSPAGRSIAQELEAMSGPNGQVRMLQAFLPAISAGYAGALRTAGVPGAWTGGAPGSAVGGGFGQLTPQPYWDYPKEDWDKMIEALNKVASITGSLASTGASKFLSPEDLDRMGKLFDQLFSITDVKTFTEAAGKLEEQLKPVTDFLSAAIKQTTDLFGRGLLAAMEAATESDARLAFLNSLSTGIKDVVFQGIVDSFLATAQFNDLLAPLQKAIRESVQHSVETGAYDGAEGVGPAIQEILARAKLLEPLATDLQKYGAAIKKILGLDDTGAANPITDAMAQSADIFGKSLIAALKAATQSDAQSAFLNSLGTGIEDVVFNGLTQAFIASAQFNDLLAPIQAQIQQFTAQAIATGEPPDIGAFRTAILPLIQGISTRADLLEPLIAVLQQLGIDIRGMLGLIPAETPQAPANVTITIVGNVNDTTDVTDLARRISEMLEPQLAPRA